MSFIVIDCETSGLNPTRHSILSLGAVDYATGEEFYGECYAESDSQLDDAALAINGFTRKQALDQSKQPDYALYMKFLAWAHCKTKRSTLLAGQQVGAFDIPFLKRIANDSKHGIVPVWPFGHRSVDLHSVAYAKLGQSLSLDGILKVVGLEPEPKPHNALTGARLEAAAFRILLGAPTCSCQS